MLKASKIYNFFKKTNLNNSFIIGYYGGGNFGDELLLEVVVNLMNVDDLKTLKVYYQNPNENFPIYHEDLGYKIIPSNSKINLLKAVLFSKNIIVGGGGHWGVDSNKSTLLLGVLLFISRNLLRKKVHLIGVGYYNSTNLYGHFSARLASYNVTTLITRDQESFYNFSKFNKLAVRDADIATLLSSIAKPKISKDKLNKFISLHESNVRTIIITQRRVEGTIKRAREQIESFIKHNEGLNRIVLWSLEDESKDTDGNNFFRQLEARYDNVIFVPFNYNPLFYHLLLKKKSTSFCLISPQYHGQMIALLNNVSLLPIVYDNKNIKLLEDFGIKHWVNIRDFRSKDIQKFINRVGI